MINTINPHSIPTILVKINELIMKYAKNMRISRWTEMTWVIDSIPVISINMTALHESARSTQPLSQSIDNTYPSYAEIISIRNKLIGNSPNIEPKDLQRLNVMWRNMCKSEKRI